jgi:hypothetical protein
MTTRPYTALLVVPTGIGAAVGGYAGDALPVARSLSAIVDTLITHPNVLNGAQLFWPLPNVLYVEGYGLDRFAAGAWGLAPVHRNRVGLLLDGAIEPELLGRQVQAAEATRATLGLDLTDYVITDGPVGVTLRRAESGATWGTVDNPGTLLRGAERLIQAGAQAIAIVARFPDDEDADALQQYRQGAGVDALAGAEAVISHLLVRQFGLPCAHAPALAPLPFDATVSPKSAAEEVGYTFLPCVLAGLSRAPQFVTGSSWAATAPITAAQVDVVMVPETACGGSAVLSLGGAGTPIIAVAENTTTLTVRPESLGLSVLRARSYLEAMGMVAAHKAGVSPAAIAPSLPRLRPLA